MDPNNEPTSTASHRGLNRLSTRSPTKSEHTNIKAVNTTYTPLYPARSVDSDGFGDMGKYKRHTNLTKSDLNNSSNTTIVSEDTLSRRLSKMGVSDDIGGDGGSRGGDVGGGGGGDIGSGTHNAGDGKGRGETNAIDDLRDFSFNYGASHFAEPSMSSDVTLNYSYEITQYSEHASQRVLSDEELEQELLKMSDAFLAQTEALEKEYTEAVEHNNRIMAICEENEHELDEIILNQIELQESIERTSTKQYSKEQAHLESQYAYGMASRHVEEYVEQEKGLTYHLSDLSKHASNTTQLMEAVASNKELLGSHIEVLCEEHDKVVEESAHNDAKQEMLRQDLLHVEETRRCLGRKIVETEPEELAIDKQLAVERGKVKILEAEIAALGIQERNLIMSRMLAMGTAAVVGITLGAFTLGLASGIATGICTLSSIYLTTLADNARHLRENALVQLLQARHEVKSLEAQKKEIDFERSKLFAAHQQAFTAAKISRSEYTDFLEQASEQRTAIETKATRIAVLTDLHQIMEKSLAHGTPNKVIDKLQEKIAQAKIEQIRWREQQATEKANSIRLRQEASDVAMQIEHLELKRRNIEIDKKAAIDRLVSHNNELGERSQFALLKETQIKAFQRIMESLNEAISEVRNTTKKVYEKVAKKSSLKRNT